MFQLKFNLIETTPRNFDIIPLPKVIGSAGRVKSKNTAKAKIKIRSNCLKLIFFQRSTLKKLDIKIKAKYIPIVEIKILVPWVYFETLNWLSKGTSPPQEINK